MKRVLFATTNKGKVAEIKEILSDYDIELLLLSDIDFDTDVDETGTTFKENAAIKARAAADHILEKKPEFLDCVVMADDSGLEIDAMGKMPGVQSHRWLGDRTYRQAMEDIINEIEGIPEEERSARFVCAIVSLVYEPDEKIWKEHTVQETVEGMVAHEICGENGFGYDPFFYVPEFGCTTAQMTPEQKNLISHRGKAVTAIGKLLLKEGILEKK